MAIPTFPEANHPVVKSLSHYNDQELLTLFQRYPDAGQHFTAIFCRYSPMVYTLIQHRAKSPVQADYLFARLWRHLFFEMGGLDLRSFGSEEITFQSWLINVTALCINQAELPPVEEIHYNLRAMSPPFWCYLDRALDHLPPTLRLMVTLAQTFRWSDTRISAYLQAEGEYVPPAEVKARLSEGYQLLETTLPDDIRAIYLDGNASVQGYGLDSASLEASLD
ncbi:RNA polymerase sigma factor [Phormidesmis priestleyi]|uniref:RNA polymerase sigma factor n=1 Tax=Phormidesmis priestleyi TaxID=268141 RepID=UPI000B2BF87E|nr:sigma-70 family RNA polymerase sigma factor [Phormidesmis priestleyi]